MAEAFVKKESRGENLMKIVNRAFSLPLKRDDSSIVVEDQD